MDARFHGIKNRRKLLPNDPPKSGGGTEQPENYYGDEGDEVVPTSILLEPVEGNISEQGSQRHVRAYVYPEEADQTVTWSIENPDIAKISQNYGDRVFIMGMSPGSTIVKATTANGLEATALIHCIF